MRRSGNDSIIKELSVWVVQTFQTLPALGFSGRTAQPTKMGSVTVKPSYSQRIFFFENIYNIIKAICHKAKATNTRELKKQICKLQANQQACELKKGFKPIQSGVVSC